jgi:hypothetical protein
MAKKVTRNEFSSNATNINVAQKTIVQSPNYSDVSVMIGIDPLVRLTNQDSKLYHTAREKRVTVEEYAHLIYGWLLINPKMLSVSDFYEYPLDNAPFIYTLDEVLAVDSDEIYNLLQERVTKMMLRKQIDRDAALSLLREKFGWNRDNEQNINLTSSGNISFKFGDANLNTPTTDNNENENNEQ